MKHPGILAVAVLGLIATPAAAQVKFSYTPVLQSGTTAGGESIAYPKTDSAEVTALMLDIGGESYLQLKFGWCLVTRVG